MPSEVGTLGDEVVPLPPFLPALARYCIFRRFRLGLGLALSFPFSSLSLAIRQRRAFILTFSFTFALYFIGQCLRGLY